MYLIGVVIPTFNRKDSLRKCLHCLKAQITAEPLFSLIIIVVVDGSVDGTAEMLKTEFPEVQTIFGDGDWWYTKCINEGIKKAGTLHCNFVLTLNDDLIFEKGYISALLGDYKVSGKNSIIGSVSVTSTEPRLITFSGVKKINLILKEFSYIPKFSLMPDIQINGPKSSVVLSGRGILYPMEIFNQFGLYDEKLVQYSSETDFTYNASKNGIPVMISYNAIVYENVQLTSSGAVYNNPTFIALLRSFKNRHSINSIQKIFYYCIKQRGIVFGNLISVLRILGILKNFCLVKIKNKA